MKIDEVAKRLMCWTAGVNPDNKKELESIGIITSLNEHWDSIPEWQKDDYRYAVVKFVEELFNLIEPKQK